MTKDTESIEISVQQTVYGAAGGPSVSGSLERSRDKAAESTYNNSTLNANNISLNSTDDTNIRGANVHANEQLMVDVGGDLNVESKQNRSRSSSVGASISGGFSFGGAEGDQASGTKSAAENGKSFSGAAKNLANLGGSNGKVSSVNVGASSNNSRSRSKETVLTSLTSGGSADINVKKNTHITGALIATQDENGKDLGNLNLTTKTLTYADLNNVNESSSRSTGISTSVGINSSANPADPAQQDAPDAQGEDNLRVNTTNIQHSNSSHYDKSKTLATLGQGNINIADKENSGDLDRLNRDVDNVDKDIVSVDRSKGNIDLTVDHRMLSEEGRKEIKEDFKRTGLLGEAIADIATEESVSLKDIFQHIGDVQKDLDVQKLMATQGNGENANILNDLANATPEQKQQAVNAYAKAYADVYDISIDEAKIVAVNSFTAGAHYSEDGSSSSIYVNDNAQNNALGYANTIGHEVTHAQIEQDTIRNRGSEELNEAYSDLRGNYAEDNYGFSFANNGLGTVNTGITNNYVGNKTSSLIAGNTTGLVTTARSNPGKMEYRPLEREETAVLNTVIGQIKESPYNSEAQNQLIGNAIAEACARTHCGEGVPESDEHYKTLQTLQQRGEALVENGQNMLANDAELFDYGWIDSKQDSLRANDEVITRVEGGAQGVLGAYGAAAGTVATVATSPACVSVAGCVAPAATAGLTALSANASLDGFNMMLGEYQSGFGQEVLNNLSADNYQDPSNPAGDLAIAAGTEVLLGATGRAAEKVADVADGIISSARSSKNADDIAQNNPLDDMGDAFEGSVGAAKAKGVDIESALATGYTKNADGSVTGPRGGNYQPTGNVDIGGNPVYTNNGKYYTLEGENTQIASPNTSSTRTGGAGKLDIPDLNLAPSSAINSIRLRNQLISQEISAGHAFEKHVVGLANKNGNEFGGLGIRTRQHFQEHIETVLNNPTHTGQLRGGREFFFDKNTNTIVIRNPKAADGGTTFRVDTNRYPDPEDYLKTLR